MKTVLRRIESICNANLCVVEDPEVRFTPLTYDIIIFFQSNRNDPLKLKYNKIMGEIVNEIPENIREFSLKELEEKVSLKKAILLEEFNRLYRNNRNYYFKWSLSLCSWILINYFEEKCVRQWMLIKNSFSDNIPMPLCFNGELCFGCEETKRLVSIYSCDKIKGGLDELKQNIQQEKERLLDRFRTLLSEKHIIKNLNLSGQTYCLISYVLKSCSMSDSGLSSLYSECRGTECTTCKSISARINQYSLTDIENCLKELKRKLYPINDM